MLKRLSSGLFFIGILTSFPAIATAQTITGKVVDETGAPLLLASVKIAGQGVTASDDNGQFTLSNIPDDTTTITVSHIGYETQQFSIDKIQNATIVLKEAQTEIKEVTVSGDKCKVKATLDALHATAAEKSAKTDECIPTACITPEYKLKETKCVCNEPQYKQNGNTCEDQVGKDCTPDDKNAKTSKYEMDGDKLVCKIQDCNSLDLEPDVKTNKCVKKKCMKPDERLNENGTCVSQKGKDCTNEIEHASKATLQLVSNKLKCIVDTCDEPGWVKNKDTNADKCIESQGPCTTEQLKKIPHASAGNLRGGECIVNDCDKGWHPADDGKKCEQAALSEEDSKKKVDELRDNAKKMKDKEQSTENKLLGAAAIGATGIGGMNLMSGMAEKSADDDAEQSMRAYLATFACDYGTGRNTRGGERDIVLPGGNDMVGIVNEYRALAADLKVRKEALGKAPGIEAQVIYDIAETGLYDNQSIGRQSGAYTSLSRALTDENSEDAKKLAEQKSAAASKVKTGAITAGAGAIGGAVGNLAINSGDNKKNKVDEINNKYQKKEGSTEQPESE